MNILTRIVEDVLVIDFGEEANLDSSNADEFREEIARHIEGKNKIVINLSNVAFLDSSGVGTLIAVWRNVSSNSGDLRLTGIRPTVRTIFEITRLHRVFEIYETEEEAIASFQSS